MQPDTQIGQKVKSVKEITGGLIPMRSGTLVDKDNVFAPDQS